MKKIQSSYYPVHYNRNVSQRDHEDIAFRLHHLAWRSYIKHLVLEIEMEDTLRSARIILKLEEVNDEA